MQCFSREGVSLDTGMHIVGSADSGQLLDGYLRYLGIRRDIQLSRLDTQAYDIVSLNDTRYLFANGHEGATESLLRHFPSCADNLKSYWDAVDSVTAAAPRYDATGLVDVGALPPEVAWRSMDSVLSTLVSDSRLADVLAGNIALYAARRGATPFATHAFVSQLYNQSAFRIVGGGEALATALEGRIKAHGGTIITRCLATRVVCRDGRATAVECVRDGAPFALQADCVVGDMHPVQLKTLFEPGLLKCSYTSRLAALPNTPSVFALFLRFKPGRVPYLNSNFHAFCQPTVWGMEHYDDLSWPRGYLYMHHAHEPHPRYASTGVVLAYMNWDDVARWADTSIGQRGADYAEWRERKAGQLLDAVERQFAGLRASVASYYTATPLTYRDYTLTPQGSMVPNFLLTGQNITAHGIMGVLIGAFNVCNHIASSMPKVGPSSTQSEKSATCAPPASFDKAFFPTASKKTASFDKAFFPTASKKTAERQTVLIMGGGLGGLLCGALLAKKGHKVTVLEAGRTAGGGLSTFRRGKTDFPTGMHVFGGYGNDGLLRGMMRYLGIEEQVEQLRTAAGGDQIMEMSHPGLKNYNLPHGREAFVDYLTKQIPASAADIAAYVDAIYRLAAEEQAVFASLSAATKVPSDEFLWPLDKFMQHYVADPALRSLLTYLSPLYAGIGSSTPAFMHAIVATLHIEGTYLFRQPSSKLAALLCNIIVEAGGSVCTGDAVTHLSVADHTIVSVRTASGLQYEADKYISDMPTNVLLSVAPPNAFPRSFVSRLKEAPVTYSAFKLFVTLRPKTFCNIDHPVYLTRNDERLMLTTMPDALDGEYASALTVIAPMSWQNVEQWADTTHRTRPDDYKTWKEAVANSLLDLVEQAFPHFRSSVESVEGASPLTLRDWTGNACGNLYGLQRDANNILASQLSPRTKLHNLFLTGQDVNIHGMVGVSMTAILSVEALLGSPLTEIRNNR